ncbi:Dipeptide-binding ABC transporter, periplasmic substrate-binding component [Pseudonocardia sp. Ae168_Ps1]|nr:Dipeptide-binding ABC transporter, periplasmic substrate-binding component [Pseudonocardia sp. Ae150A_Ps1]OLL80086.1 Dipeptide-binding ABC transporter, periplasmic substrate-binding component [Pseudonocardia sp. Ae168_Ps1]OLL85783.1 Dipeptide-binding ABC transporter, periplasmic substrate-binding component [Pseudonocardia sp. Ae263_Ps1]OLL94186.1 Dipeptide-binding ABC transporter, periplasmic substrate-binding component [Pseudonocardia sp. Ae356_Ps1]
MCRCVIALRNIAVPLLAALVVAGCSAPTPAPGESAPTGDPTTMTLADGYEPDDLNPLLGYGAEGASKFYDGLYAHDADRALQPALAAGEATPSPDRRSWTVPLRQGVTFHDGSTFGPEDVVATYRAILAPDRAATIGSAVPMLERVEPVGTDAVRFDLSYAYGAFPARLTSGILPSEVLQDGGPVADLPVNTRPVGTGPYSLVEWRRGDTMVLQANEGYWGGAPAVKRVTVVFATDDNTRAQRVGAGEFDGTVLPPALAKAVAAQSGMALREHSSADYRTIALPFANPVTADPAIRAALNRAVNRQGMVDALLAGQGRPASNPIPDALPEQVEPSAAFDFDPAGAARLLDEAGWAPGPDGVRARNGQAASFSLMYPATDTIRRDLAQAFASDARAAGIDVRLEGLGWEAIEPRMGRDALVLGGGDPFDPGFKSWQLLHSSNAADGFNNPGSYSNPQVDAALDAALRAPDDAARDEQIRAFQRAYAADPGMVFLVFVGHSYVSRDSWDGYVEVVEPHTHGVTWGPWWNLEDWTPKQ